MSSTSFILRFHHFVINICTYSLFLFGLVGFYLQNSLFFFLQNASVEAVTATYAWSQLELFASLVFLLGTFAHIRLGIENILYDYVHNRYSREFVLSILDLILSSLSVLTLILFIRVIFS